MHYICNRNTLCVQASGIGQHVLDAMTTCISGRGIMSMV